MIQVTLPDGNIRSYSKSISGLDLAKDISPSLAKAALAVVIDSKLADLSTIIEKDSQVRIITSKDAESLEIIHHDAAHILAQAIKNLYPKTQITIGPVIENGFYYDVLPEKNLSEDDLEKLEVEMHRISNQDLQFEREVWDRTEAIKFFKSIGEDFKAEIIAAIPGDEPISLYRQGDFIDLCRGPHATSTKHVKHFKLMKLAGAYWRGDSNNVMLQRIYGTAWRSKEELDAYLHMLEEAEKRDHRKIGKELDLFHIQEEAPGMVFWHNKGWTIFRILENFIRHHIKKNDYIEVKTPMLVDKSLWERSGHWEKFREHMFTSESEDKIMALKPMNCPCHIEIFKIGTKSYRDLPIRMAEFGSCHRNESSGSLHGLLRVRGLTQDDAHIFCTEEQITSETVAFCNLLSKVYNQLGFKEFVVKFSDRPDVRAGSDDVWDKAEESLKSAVQAAGLSYILNKGEGAFYGPKLEFVLKDAIGRDWQCGTLQVDFILPERLGAVYIGSDGNKHVPVMIHRAILGTLERFIGVLIEQYEGKFPLWLAPDQISIVTITSDADHYAEQVKSELDKVGYRTVLDISNEKINYKIRHHSLQKVPFIIVVGKQEVENKTISVRRLGSSEQDSLTLPQLLNELNEKNKY
jgi:threonyl-tRNA synthetase